MTIGIFKTPYYHGTSLGAIGSQQMKEKLFEVQGPRECAHLWATPDPSLAKQYAVRSAQRTKTPAVLAIVETNQPLQPVEYGIHSYPAFNTAKAPVYIKKIIPMDNKAAMFAANLRFKLPSILFGGAVLMAAGGFGYKKLQGMIHDRL